MLVKRVEKEGKVFTELRISKKRGYGEIIELFSRGVLPVRSSSRYFYYECEGDLLNDRLKRKNEETMRNG